MAVFWRAHPPPRPRLPKRAPRRTRCTSPRCAPAWHAPPTPGSTTAQGHCTYPSTFSPPAHRLRMKWCCDIPLTNHAQPAQNIMRALGGTSLHVGAKLRYIVVGTGIWLGSQQVKQYNESSKPVSPANVCCPKRILAGFESLTCFFLHFGTNLATWDLVRAPPPGPLI